MKLNGEAFKKDISIYKYECVMLQIYDTEKVMLPIVQIKTLFKNKKKDF